jgi:hypothetical protein
VASNVTQMVCADVLLVRERAGDAH